MPFPRPTISQLQTQAAQDIAAALPGSDPLLRFSNLGILGTALAGLTYLLYGYIDWVGQQSTPVTSTGEFLESWAAVKGVYRLPAASATGSVQGHMGTGPGVVIPEGTTLVRGDGQKFVTTAAITTSTSSPFTIPVKGVPDPSGLVGAIQNTPAGSILSFGVPFAGVPSSVTVFDALTGGADLETDESLRDRMLRAYRNPGHGGSLADYQQWTLEVPGVTRVWVAPNGYGPGSVVVYPMFDHAEAAHGGFPQGTNGVATSETRGVQATGDLLAVADYIMPLQPVTALVYVVAAVPQPINLTITGLSAASPTVKAAVQANLAAVIAEQGSALGCTISVLSLEGAISNVPGTSAGVLTTPAASIVVPVGHLPTMGTVTWA
jgi:uncharacterized phage protein gp47/JayE